MAFDLKSFAPLLTGPLLKRMKWTWVGYGVAAYVGLRLMQKYKIMPNFANRGVDLMEKGARLARP